MRPGRPSYSDRTAHPARRRRSRWNATRDDAPNHIKVQRRVPREVAETWVAMCPAQVYEIPEDQAENGAKEIDLNITPSNCVQCGAITAKGGRLTPPEGGDGPRYQET